MEKELLRKVQLTQLEIAKEIRRVCEENDIRYFLSGGTFLGAVRHHGFIPWDDDMDMAMLRQDYERFCAIAPEKLKPQYAWQSWYTDENYSLPFGKVVKRNTVYLEGKKSARLKENGFYVDVFPIDNIPVDSKQYKKYTSRLLAIYRKKLMKSGYQPWIDNNRILWKKRLGYLYYQFLAMFSDQKKLSSSYDALACSVGLTGWVCEQEAATHPKRLDASIFSECVEYEFENERFVGVRDYDKYLTTLYGDYMQLPPEDQRENRHQIVQIDFGPEDNQ